MRRLIKNITDSNLRRELQLIWDRINFIETKTVEPSTSNLAPGEAAIYSGNLYVNDRNTIRQFDIEGGDSNYLKADGSVDLTGNMDVDSGVTIDGVDISSHASRHVSGGADSIKLDDLASPDDNTDLNASTSKHGLLKKLDNDATHYLDGQGSWSALQDHDHTGDAGDGGQLAQYLLANGARDLTGNLSVDALITIDGRDLSVDGSKLDGIESGATADQTESEIKSLSLDKIVCLDDEVVCNNDEVVYI